MIIALLCVGLGGAALLKCLFTGNSSVIPYSLILILIGGWSYLYGVHQFWNAAKVDATLSLNLPGTKTDAEWLNDIAANFQYQDAQLESIQDNGSLVYAVRGAEIVVSANARHLNVSVEHMKNGGHGMWTLSESFSGEDLKTALAYFLEGKTLPDNFEKLQKQKHKDKIGLMKVVLPVAIAALLLVSYVFGELLSTPEMDLRNSVWPGYSETQTLGEGFGANFKHRDWNSYEADGQTMISFSGTVDFSDRAYDASALIGKTQIQVRLLFSVQETDDGRQFSLESVEIDGDDVYMDEAMAVMQFGFDGDKEALLQTLYYYQLW